MQIIFDNKEQQLAVIKSFCIDELFVDRDESCCMNCEECWERHVQMEVEDEDHI